MSHIGFLKHNIEDINKSSMHLIDINFTHACITGETGSGKTTSIINPNLDNRIKKGHGVLVFDHKGNYHLTVKALAKRHNRLKDVVVIGMPWDKKCNIIDSMDENLFVDFMRFLVSHKSEDKFWEQSAVSVAFTIWKVLSALEMMEKFEIFEKLIKEITKKYQKKLTTIHKITSSKAEIKKFKKSLERLDFMSCSDAQQIINELLNKIDKKSSIKAINVYGVFKEAYSELMDEFSESKLKSDNKTYDNILISLNNPISNVARHTYINESEIDINKALNSGKIVVFICNQLPEIVLAALTKSIFNNFLERISDKRVKDVTVFIDEAQKVLNREIELPIDTIREARVDVIMAFQSKALLIDRLGEIKSKALFTNLTSKYYFKNSSNDDGMESDRLGKFEFLTNIDKRSKVYKATPLFLDESELFQTEIEYQKMIKAYDSYKEYLPKRGKEYMLKFIPSLYSRGKITIAYRDGTLRDIEIPPKPTIYTIEKIRYDMENLESYYAQRVNDILDEVDM
jgi:type IV secretory pathway TraG/TraD family ATPase VirD4